MSVVMVKGRQASHKILIKNFLKGKKVKLPGELVYETGMPPSKIGAALAEIRESKQHFHEKTSEWYYVIKGRGDLFLDGKRVHLSENDFVQIPTKARHFVKSSGSSRIKLLAITVPPWSNEDHHLV